LTNRSDAGAGASLTLTLLMLEVMHGGVVTTRFNRFFCVQVIVEQNADAFAPRVTAHSVYDSIAVSTRLLKPSFTCISFI